MAAPKVSVIVPVRNAAATLGALLDSLQAQHGVGFETIVIVNASTDASASIARTHPLDCHIVVTDEPGAYHARNAGARLAIASNLAFIDADCQADPDWLGQGLLSLEEAHLVGGAIEQVTSSAPSLWEEYDAAFYLRQQDNIANGFAATANAFVTQDTFGSVGGFDESFISGGDHDFGVRLRARGATIAYAPDAIVRHRARATAGEVLRTQRRIGAGWHDLAKAHSRPGLVTDRGLRPGFAEARRQVKDGSSLGVGPGYTLLMASSPWRGSSVE